MNKFLKLLSIFLLGAFVFSCSSDKVEEPKEDSSDPNLELAIFLDGSVVSSSVAEEEIYYESASMEYATGLIYVIHSVEDGQFVKSNALWGDDLKKIRINEDKKEIAILKERLPEGKYYVSVISLTQSQILPALTLKLLEKPYAEAVCVIDPRENIYFHTMEVTVTNQEVAKTEAELTRMTSAYVYLFRDVKQIATDAEVQISVLVKGLPSAFYLRNGQTLTNLEETELGIKRFSNTRVISEKPTSQVMAKFYLLENKDLPEKGSERGTLNIVTSIESPGSGGAKSKIVNTVFPSKRSDYTIVVDEIFSTKEPEIIVY